MFLHESSPGISLVFIYNNEYINLLRSLLFGTQTNKIISWHKVETYSWGWHHSSFKVSNTMLAVKLKIKEHVLIIKSQINQCD